MIKYIVHLKVPYYDYAKNESQKNIKIGQDKLNDKALKEFSANLIKIDGASLLPDEYTGQTMTKAVLISIEEKKFENVLKALVACEMVNMIEPEKYK